MLLSNFENTSTPSKSAISFKYGTANFLLHPDTVNDNSPFGYSTMYLLAPKDLKRLYVGINVPLESTSPS